MINPYDYIKDFPMLNTSKKMQDHNLVFLDNASTTFKPSQVIDSINNYLIDETSNSHRGDYDLCYNVDQKVLDTRRKVAKFINANSDEIVFTMNATMSINTIAFGYGVKFLKGGDEILLDESEHASNVLPWFKLGEITGAKIRFIPLDEKGRITVDNVKKTITNHTKIISITHVSNVLGYVNDIKSICKLAHENDIVVVVDGAQSVPHMKIDVRDLDADFLVFSAHKMCGPTGIGILYGKYHLLDKMDPFVFGGGMNVKFNTSLEVKYLNPPEKFEAGTLNLEGIYGLNAAIDYLMNIGMKNIHQYEIELRKYMISKMEEIPNVIFYNKDADSGIVTFNIKGVFAQDEATYLNSKGIACRSGQHCAKILPSFLNEIATVRASLYFYTTKEDIDILVDTIKNGGDFLDAYFA